MNRRASSSPNQSSALICVSDSASPSFRRSKVPAFFLVRLRAVHDARRYIEPVSEFVDEEGSHGRVIATKSGRRRNLNTKVGTVARAQRCHSTANQCALTRPNVGHYFDRGHGRDLGCIRDFCPQGRDPFHTLHKPRQRRIRRNRKASTCEPDPVVTGRRNGFHQSPFARRLLVQSRSRGQSIFPTNHPRKYQHSPFVGIAHPRGATCGTPYSKAVVVGVIW
jgi:hypothetical protein